MGRAHADTARATDPALAPMFSRLTNRDLRREIADVVPLYVGIEDLAATGDEVQWGGRHLCVDGAFPTASGRARFSVLEPDVPALGMFTVATRRGKQFNSMVWKHQPCRRAPRGRPCTSTTPMRGRSAWMRGPVCGSTSEHGVLDGTLKLVRLPARTLQVHWPEGNVLLGSGADLREPRHSHVPDYNALVTLEPLG